MTLLYYGIFETQEDIVAEVYLLPVNKTVALYNTTNNYGVNYVLKEFGEEEIG